MSNDEFNLSQITPDFDGIRAQLQAELAAEKVWSGNETSPVGASLLRLLSAIGTLDQHKILRGTQDAFQETALSDRAIYSLMDMQGVRVPRKTPAQVPVLLKNPTNISIPAYTQFQSSGTYFFNRSPISLVGNIEQEVVLYQGQVTQIVTYGLGTDYQMYSPPESSFNISNSDVEVRIGANPIERTTEGLWNFRDQAVFQDRTMPDGRLMIHFGTPSFGYRPSTEDVVTITYVVTAGLIGNAFTTLDNKVFTDVQPNLEGTILGNPTGGRNEPQASQLRVLPSPYFGTFSSALTPRQTRTMALDFGTDVLDVRTFSQREVNPRALEWFNLLRFVLLTDHPWTSLEQETFVNFAQARVVQNSRIQLSFSQETPIDLEVNLYFFNYANLEEGKADVDSAITSFFKPQRGRIDFDVYRSDLSEVIKESTPGLDYFELVTPTSEVTIIKREAANAPTVVINPLGGTLVAGSSHYGILVHYPDGDVTVRNWVQVLHSADDSVSLTWSPVPTAVGYSVYVDSELRKGLLASVSSGTTNYTDTGNPIIGSAAPAFNTAPTRHPVKGVVTLNPFYSTRTARGV